MTLATELLEQASRLTRAEPKKPKQASLRRSISSAYYSLFHLIISDGAKLITSNSALRPSVARCFQHNELKKNADLISSRNLTNHWLSNLLSFPLEPELISVCQAFSDLQKSRHDADYDIARTFTRSEALAAVSRAITAHEDWKKIQKSDNRNVFLLASAKILVSR